MHRACAIELASAAKAGLRAASYRSSCTYVTSFAAYLHICVFATGSLQCNNQCSHPVHVSEQYLACVTCRFRTVTTYSTLFFVAFSSGCSKNVCTVREYQTSAHLEDEANRHSLRRTINLCETHKQSNEEVQKIKSDNDEALATSPPTTPRTATLTEAHSQCDAMHSCSLTLKTDALTKRVKSVKPAQINQELRSWLETARDQVASRRVDKRYNLRSAEKERGQAIRSTFRRTNVSGKSSGVKSTKQRPLSSTFGWRSGSFYCAMFSISKARRHGNTLALSNALKMR